MRDISAQERLTIETELQLLKNFRHPNIVAFKDSFIDNNDSLNIVMPYCEGSYFMIQVETCTTLLRMQEAKNSLKNKF